MDEKDPAYGEALSLIRLLEKNKFPSRLVGGCVRDRLLGVQPKDYDIATTAKPDDIISIMEAAQVKVIATAPEHGTITAILPSGPVEMTTLREDVATDGRRAIVSFGQSFEEDAKRRDFTINSLSEDSSGKIYDYFSGQEHLKAKKLVFVGSARKRIQEDYLRTLRLYRFQSRFGFSFDEVTQKAVMEEREGLRHLSAERVTLEMEQIIQGEYARYALENMLQAKLWAAIFPFLEEEQVDIKKLAKKVLDFCDQPLREQCEKPWIFVLAILFIGSYEKCHDKEFSKFVEESCRKIKISLNHMDQVKSLVLGYLGLASSFEETADILFFC